MSCWLRAARTETVGTGRSAAWAGEVVGWWQCGKRLGELGAVRYAIPDRDDALA